MALQQAMGESVRPVTPGGDSGRRKKPSAPAAAVPQASSTALWDPFLRAEPGKKVTKVEPATERSEPEGDQSAEDPSSGS